MKPSRRRFLHIAAGVVALPVTPRIAGAQSYPSRPVRIVVGLPPGGVNDILARMMGQWLSDRLGQPFIIENRPGASGNIATEAVVKAAPDGYTLMLVGSQNTVNVTLFDRVSFNLLRDIAPVAGITRQPNVLLINPSMSPKTVPEFIAYAKANPGKLNMASTGSGTPSHVSGELFKMLTGADMTHVPYRGGAPALTDLISGQVQVYFGVVGSSLAHIKAGTVRALAVTTAARSDALPDIPTIGEFVPGYEASGLFGFGAPKNTPTEIVERLNKEINAALSDPKMKARLSDMGGTELSGSAADFGKLIADEIEKWARVIKFAGIKAE